MDIFIFTYKCMLVILLSSLSAEVYSNMTCGRSRTIGYTFPPGDITLRYGEALNITCNLNENQLRTWANASSRLYFSRNNTVVSKDEIEILNRTSIRLYIKNHPNTSNDNYYCTFQRIDNEPEFVCMNVVVVGVPPQKVTDFYCLSRNYDNLTCTWTPPQNFVKTDYSLSYTLRSRSARKHPFICPNLKYEDKQMSCFWNLSTRPQYRLVHKTFFFNLAFNNTFGSDRHFFVFDHFKHMLPNPPEKLTAVATSPHSVHLNWSVSVSLYTFPPGLYHRIHYYCEYEKEWLFAGNITNRTKDRVLDYELTGLKYAHALWDIRVSILSADADGRDESLWSNNASVTVRTKVKIPDCPPETNLGSFEIIVTNGFFRDVYIYWKQIQEEQRNGQNFSYAVEVENRPFMRPVELTKAYAKFENLDCVDYTIHIWSENEVGRSAEKSTVFIPAKRITEPQNFVKVAYGEDLYTLSWDPPDSPGITNYTIFWCSNGRDRPFQCVGNLNWTTVSNETRRYNQSLFKDNRIYQFAISANSERNSSGMSWAECTIIPNRNLGKMKNVWISKVGSDFIEMGWKMECSDRIDSLEGFVIFYCPISSPIGGTCNGTQQNVTLYADKTLQAGRVDGLLPYTTYQLSVAVRINNTTISGSSRVMYNTTTEGAPTSPQNVTIYDVTNSSISLGWLPPKAINGMLREYVIYYNNDNITLRDKEKDVGHWTLKNLESYKEYVISVVACTVVCSERYPIKVMTRMGLPGEIKMPVVTKHTDNVIVIEWNRPELPRGKIDYYQLKFSQKIDKENRTVEPTVNVTSAESYSIKSCGDSGKYDIFFVSVRAVNVIDGIHYYGNWSKPLEAKCSQFSSLIYVILSIFLVMFIIGVVIAFKKLYVVCKNMQNVEVKLPPGLAPVVERDLVHWGSEKHPEDIDRNSRADEELLLDKIVDVQLSGDSSGCSSGHESISSSLETATHFSTDSGTEQPRTLTDENRKNSLRQRNVNKAGYVLPEAVASMNWGAKPAPTPASNYCVIGVDPTNQCDTELHYKPLSDDSASLDLPYMPCDLPSQTSPHVTSGEFVRSANPGYVPYIPPEPANKNGGYVVAGLSNDPLVPSLSHCDSLKQMSSEEKSGYTKTDNLANVKTVQFPWQQSQPDTNFNKAGYVSVGDALPPTKTTMESTKGYVPHRQFETKSLKED